MSGSFVHISRVLLAIACLLVAMPAAAGETPMEIDFEVTRGEEPSHLCVVSGMPLQRSEARKALIDNMASAKDALVRAMKASRKGQWTLLPDLRKIIESTSADLDTNEAGAARPRGRLAPSQVALRVAEAFRASADPADGCRTGNPECASRVTFVPGDIRLQASPQKASVANVPVHIVCVKNKEPSVATSPGSSRLVFLRLDLFVDQEVTVQITNVSLSRDKVKITLAGGDKPPPVPSVLVIGADYREDTGRTRGGRIVVPLVPRCRDVPVQLPASSDDSGDAQVTLEVPGLEAWPCNVPLGKEGNFLLAVPMSPRLGKRVLALTAHRPGTGDNRYRASWYTESLPPAVTLRHSTVSFAWKPSCHYPRDDNGGLSCPTEVRVDAPVECEKVSQDESRCAWECRPAAAGAGARDTKTPEFDLPLQVHFTGASQETWTDTLSHTNQELTGYVAPGDRVLRVTFPEWTPEGTSFVEANRWYAQVRAVLLSVGGAVYRVPVRNPAVVRVPNVGCEESILYEIEADRPHFLGSGEVDHGRIEIRPPAQSERRINLGLGATGSILISKDDAVNVRPAGGIQAIVSLRPRELPVVFELRGGISISTQSYTQLPDANLSAGRDNRVAYNRYLFDVSAWGIPFQNLRLGLGAGVAFGHPTLGEDWLRAGGVQASPVLFAAGRVYLRDQVSFDIQAGAVIQESLFRLTANGYRGSPALESRDVASFLLALQLNFWPWGRV